MKHEYSNKTNTQAVAMPKQLNTNLQKQNISVTEKISISTILLLCIVLLMMTGCANYGGTHTSNALKPATKPIYLVMGKGDTCAVLNKEIADILAYDKKFIHSQYANHYHAMTREKLFSIEPRAKQANCTYSFLPANTKLYNISSI